MIKETYPNSSNISFSRNYGAKFSLRPKNLPNAFSEQYPDTLSRTLGIIPSRTKYIGKKNRNKGFPIYRQMVFDDEIMLSRGKKNPFMLRKTVSGLAVSLIAAISAAMGITVTEQYKTVSEQKTVEETRLKGTVFISEFEKPNDTPEETYVYDENLYYAEPREYSDIETSEEEDIDPLSIKTKFINHELYDSFIAPELAEAVDNRAGAGFCAEVEKIAEELKCNPNDLLIIFYNESGINPRSGEGGDGTVGIAQFSQHVADSNDMTKADIIEMSAIEQLKLVRDNFIYWKKAHHITEQELDGATLYALNFVPSFALNEDYLVGTGSYYYDANAGADLDDDGFIRKDDLAEFMHRKFFEMVNDLVPGWSEHE